MSQRVSTAYLRNFSNSSFPLASFLFPFLCYPLIYWYPSRKDRLVLTNSNGISLMTYFFAEPTCLQTAYSTPTRSSVFCKHVFPKSTDMVAATLLSFIARLHPLVNRACNNPWVFLDRRAESIVAHFYEYNRWNKFIYIDFIFNLYEYADCFVTCGTHLGSWLYA